MCKAESEVRPTANALDHHGIDFGGPTGYIDAKMRAIAVSWLVEVTAEFDMHQETLFLAVNLLDRFLSVTKVCAWLLHLINHFWVSTADKVRLSAGLKILQVRGPSIIDARNNQ